MEWLRHGLRQATELGADFHAGAGVQEELEEALQGTVAAGGTGASLAPAPAPIPPTGSGSCSPATLSTYRCRCPWVVRSPAYLTVAPAVLCSNHIPA